MSVEQIAAPISLQLDQPAITVRLVVAAGEAMRRVRWLLNVADALAAAGDVDRHDALLEIAEAYRRAADAGQYSPLIRDAMLAAELRARRLAEHLA